MKTYAFLTSCFFLISLSLFAQKSIVFSPSNKAIKGYDVVSYFKTGEAVKGLDAYTFEWNGSIWYFSSEENKETFHNNPEAFVPQFGGYCAYAVSQGYTYRSNPEAWKIVEGKLYLNYNFKIQKKWEENMEAFIKAGNENWPKVLE